LRLTGRPSDPLAAQHLSRVDSLQAMELRVETADGSNLPKGCFVSVRVGDVQKQRRYETKGAFQFPAPAHSRKAKIDLYMHVGTCSVSVGPEEKTSQVSVQALEPNAPRAELKVVSTLKQEAVVDRETKMSNVKREAVEYLGKWLIQERLGEAVKALLQKRPDDPIDFICGYLRANANVQPEPIKKPEPVAKKEEAVPVIPFTNYYRRYLAPAATSCFPQVYSKFPAPKRPVQAPITDLGEVKTKARLALEKAFMEMDEDEAAQKAAAPPPAVARAPMPLPEHLKAGAPPSGFGVYYKEHMEATMPESPWGELYGKFNSKAASAKAPAPAPAPAPVRKQTGPGFKVMPSVGTWLKPKPCVCVVANGDLPTHLKASWDLQGLRPAACQCLDERLEAERIVSNALLELTGELEGEYLPLPGSTSYPARPDGMSENERRLLSAGGMLPEATDSLGRGVFVNKKRDIAVWVNSSRHVELIVKQEFISPQEGMLKLRAVEKALSQALTQEGHDLAVPMAKSSKRLVGIRAPGVMDADERCEVERVCTRAFLELSGDLEGEYFPLATSMSYPPRPGGMTAEEETAVAGNGVIVGPSDATGRGIFIANSGDLAATVNGEEHIEFFTRCPNMSPSAAKARIQCIESSVRDSIRQSGFDFV